MTGEFNSANPADDTVPIEDGGGGGGYYGGGYYGGGGGDYGGGYEPVGGYYGGHSAGYYSGTINASGDSYGPTHGYGAYSGDYGQSYGYGVGPNAPSQTLTDSKAGPLAPGNTTVQSLPNSVSTTGGADAILAGAQTILANENGGNNEAAVEIQNNWYDPNTFSYDKVEIGPTTPDGYVPNVTVQGDYTEHGHLSDGVNGYPVASGADLSGLADNLENNSKSFSAIVGPNGNITVYATQQELNSFGLGYNEPASGAPTIASDGSSIPPIYKAFLAGGK